MQNVYTVNLKAGKSREVRSFLVTAGDAEEAKKKARKTVEREGNGLAVEIVDVIHVGT